MSDECVIDLTEKNSNNRCAPICVYDPEAKWTPCEELEVTAMTDKTTSEYYWRQCARAPFLFGVETKSLERALRAAAPDINFETLRVVEVSENSVEIPVVEGPDVIWYERDEPQPLSKLDLFPSDYKYGKVILQLHPIEVDGVTLFVDYDPKFNILALRSEQP